MDNSAQQSIPPEMLPDQEFMEMINRIEGPQKASPKVTESSTDDVIMVDTPSGPIPLPRSQSGAKPPEPITAKEPEEIKLEYRFSGDCPKHVTAVSTLSAEVDGKSVIFAFCIECKKNIHSRVVPYLNPHYNESIEDTGYTQPKKRTFTRKGKELLQ
jgi:hypothetical protein